MGHILGISAGFHDAAISIIDCHGHIVFAGHSERYSKVKNDHKLHADLLKVCSDYFIHTVSFYERPWMHNVQQFLSGQHDYRPWTVKQRISSDSDGALDWLMESRKPPRTQAFGHHLSHAAAGFQTSPFESAAVVVIDAIGELDTVSIYRAWYDKTGRAHYRRLWRQGYPHSVGLFYSAVTDAIGLKPMEEEYITMGMAAYGSSAGYRRLQHWFVDDMASAKFKENLHTGLDHSLLKTWKKESLAASAQKLTENMIMNLMSQAKALSGESNLVYMGGVALNCVANSKLGKIFDEIWIMPNPGDAGSSLGAAALSYGKKLHWKNAFLGHDIQGQYPIQELCDQLASNGIVGVASGRAEFGPRALGNRSLLADPRGRHIKDRVNEIKRRQKFRPFAPVILEELAQQYFAMPEGFANNRYMQAVATCLRPDLYPAVCHVDDTSRVQTVPKDGSGIRRLLEEWYRRTGCPMLLNTSLNIRGEPMVNDRKDANRFQKLYGMVVVS